jgi:sorting nexin-1/2
MQLDAEEDENAFYKPPVEPSARKSEETAVDSQAATAVRDDDEDDE